MGRLYYPTDRAILLAREAVKKGRWIQQLRSCSRSGTQFLARPLSDPPFLPLVLCSPLDLSLICLILKRRKNTFQIDSSVPSTHSDGGAASENSCWILKCYQKKDVCPNKRIPYPQRKNGRAMSFNPPTGPALHHCIMNCSFIMYLPSYGPNALVIKKSFPLTLFENFQ